jgi:PRTRC genetic system protein C
MKISVPERVFTYNGATLPDPGMSADQVRSFYANQFPELTTAAISGPENTGGKLRYSFTRAIGTKG